MVFPAHIFFDDAFDYVDGNAQANGYVKQLMRTIDSAIRFAFLWLILHISSHESAGRGIEPH